MVQRRGGPRFLLEAGKAIGIRRETGRQDFDRDITTKPRIARAIDLAHAACADGGENFIRPEASAGREGHVGFRGLYVSAVARSSRRARASAALGTARSRGRW